ncbi:H-type lectin domain-containing protein [Streptomyces scopuliridis]
MPTYYSNTALPTTLSGSISSGATTITVGATTGFPGSFPYTLALDYGSGTEELVSVSAAAGPNLTVIRGFSGTSAQSHSLGAVVRHVYHAGDAADFRSHEAASVGVHGISGAVVGTSDTQTLANKTLTNASLTNSSLTGGGSFNGTFIGSPTFSGAPLFNGSPTFSGGPTFTTLSALWERTATTDNAIRVRVQSDTNSRFLINADGRMVWGSGSASGDASLSRSAANTLATDSQVVASRPLSTDITWGSQRTADSGARWQMTANGMSLWGTGAGLMDVNLYRAGSDLLRTDDSLVVGGSLTAGNIQSGSVSFTTTAGAWASQTVTFPTMFATPPVVCVTGNNAIPSGGTSLMYCVTGISTTGFTLGVNRGTVATMNIGWIAIA